MNSSGKRFSIVIPCAKLLNSGMQGEFGPIPSGLVPLGGKVAIEKIIESFGGSDFDVYIGVEEGANFVEEYFAFFPDPRVKIAVLENSTSISDTIEKIFGKYPAILQGPVVLNFADTIVGDLEPGLFGRDFISYSRKIETERWTLFKFDSSKIIEISDKEYQDDLAPWFVFVGVWGFKDAEAFYRLLQEENRKNNKKAFYECIKKYAVSSSDMELFETQEWIDCGYVDNYYSAKRKMVATRFFNNVTHYCPNVEDERAR